MELGIPTASAGIIVYLTIILFCGVWLKRRHNNEKDHAFEPLVATLGAVAGLIPLIAVVVLLNNKKNQEVAPPQPTPPFMQPGVTVPDRRPTPTPTIAPTPSPRPTASPSPTPSPAPAPLRERAIAEQFFADYNAELLKNGVCRAIEKFYAEDYVTDNTGFLAINPNKSQLLANMKNLAALLDKIKLIESQTTINEIESADQNRIVVLVRSKGSTETTNGNTKTITTTTELARWTLKQEAGVWKAYKYRLLERS